MLNTISLSADLEKMRKEIDFPMDQIPIAVRANFCCEYCGRNLLDSIDAYDSWQIDHIIPGGGEGSENKALTCKTCNFAKRSSTTEALVKASSRAEKIEEARKIVWERRAKKERTLLKVKEFAVELMKYYDKNT